MREIYRADPTVVTWWGSEIECVSAFARVHPLRSADSVQLPAAVIAADREPAALEIVSLDARLASAARREGFTVLSADAG
jgi:hypothetical protein